LSKLIQYTHQHFGREERFWKSRGYSEWSEHKDEHQEMIRQIGIYTGCFALGDGMLAENVMEFLRDWLINHMQRSDRVAAAAVRWLAQRPDDGSADVVPGP
jgi:hemerythrin-like metal-binding protein